MNPGRNPKKTFPLPHRQVENQNEVEKDLLRDKVFFDGRTRATVAAIARVVRRSSPPAAARGESALQQFGVLAAAARMRAGLTVEEAAQRAGLNADVVFAIELGVADFALVSEAVNLLGAAVERVDLGAVLAELVLGDEGG